jgi:hypothetical protein
MTTLRRAIVRGRLEGARAQQHERSMCTPRTRTLLRAHLLPHCAQCTRRVHFVLTARTAREATHRGASSSHALRTPAAAARGRTHTHTACADAAPVSVSGWLRACTFPQALQSATPSTTPTYPACYTSTYVGQLVSTTGVVSASAAGKGLGYSTTAQLAWLATQLSGGASAAAGQGVELYLTSGLSNTLSRGDVVTVTGHVLSQPGGVVLEVCSFVSAGANVGALPAVYALPVTTAMFTAPADVGASTLGANASLVAGVAGAQRGGGWCSASATRPMHGSLVTLTAAVVVPCANNPATLAPAGGKLVYYGVCQPTLTASTDAYYSAGCSATYANVCSTNVCASCAWDKYSTFWVSTDGGATVIAVSSTLFRVFNTFTVTAGTPSWATRRPAGGPASATTFATLTGVLDYVVPASSTAAWPQAQWTLVPRDQYDIGGGVLAPTGNLPSVIIGTIKQQTNMWSSPGPASLALVPPELLGAQDTITPAGVTPAVMGTANYFGVTPPVVGWSSGCPNASATQWIYAGGSLGGTGNTRQSLCNCFPPNYYDPNLGSNGGGTSYVTISGVVAMIEGVASGSGVGSFYLENACTPNHSLYVFQDSSAGRVVTLGDYVTITATAFSYYGLVEMQNTLSVVVVNHSNPICRPLALPSLAVLDVASNGHCGATTVQYRANRVTVNYVTVTKVFMLEPFPTTLSYWYNFTAVSLYSAAFNASIGKAGNWYGMSSCRDANGALLLHPATGKSFICGFEVTDTLGNKAIVDQCPYSSNGGLAALFMGTDYAGAKPLAVGDTFTSISGVLKYQRGSYGADGGGGYLSLCALMDPVGAYMAGRNTPWPANLTAAASTSPPSVVVGASLVQSAMTLTSVDLAALSTTAMSTAVTGAAALQSFGAAAVAPSDFSLAATYSLSGTGASALVGNAAFASNAAILLANVLADSPTLQVAVTCAAPAAGRRALLQTAAVASVSVTSIGPSLVAARAVAARLTGSTLVIGQLATAATQALPSIATPTVSFGSLSATAVLSVTVAVVNASNSAAAAAALNAALAMGAPLTASLVGAAGSAAVGSLTQAATVVAGVGAPGPPPVFVPVSSDGTGTARKVINTGGAVGIAVGGFVAAMLCAFSVYRLRLRKKLIEEGQRSAVMLSPMASPATTAGAANNKR